MCNFQLFSVIAYGAERLLLLLLLLFLYMREKKRERASDSVFMCIFGTRFSVILTPFVLNVCVKRLLRVCVHCAVPCRACMLLLLL